MRWSIRKLDLDGDLNYNETGELNENNPLTSSNPLYFNAANEWLKRDTDNNGSPNYTLTYDAVGNLTDDGEAYKFVYDAFGRLVEVKNQSNAEIGAIEIRSSYLDDAGQTQRATSQFAKQRDWLYLGPCVWADVTLTNQRQEQIAVFEDELLALYVDGKWWDAQGRPWIFRREPSGRPPAGGFVDTEVVIGPTSRKAVETRFRGVCIPKGVDFDDGKPVEDQVSYPAELHYSVDTTLRGPSKTRGDVRVRGTGLARLTR
jgi:YD repeat-containing protein